MRTLYYPIRVPSGVLEDLGKFTGHFWSDTLALEPFICEAIHNHMHTQVEGNAIKCGEQVMPPSQFANLRGSGNRNAAQKGPEASAARQSVIPVIRDEP